MLGRLRSPLCPSNAALTALVLALCSALLLAAASPASAVTRKQATKKALKAFGPAKAGERVVVFGLPKPLKAGTVITQRGSTKAVAKVRRGRAFFFYRDARAGRPYPHPGRVALVAVRSGKVKLSAGFMWQPLVNGKLPPFLDHSPGDPDGYVVFDGSSGKDGSSGTQSGGAPAGPGFVFDAPLAPIGGGSDSGPSPWIGFTPLAQGNGVPKANGVALTTKAGGSKRITLTAFDEDADDLTFHITSPPRNGTLSGGAPDVVYTPNPGFVGQDSFSFKVNDGFADSNAAVVRLTVVPRGVPPVVTASAGCTTYNEQAPAVAIDDQAIVSDIDDLTLEGATVRIDYGPQAPQDPDDPAPPVTNGDDLVFTDQNGIMGSYSDRTGVLTLTGMSSVANYQAALRSVQYRNLSSANPEPTKNVIFTVDDGGGDSAPAPKELCIVTNGVNDPPIAETFEGAVSYVENDGPVAVDPGFVAGDPDSANLSGATVKFLPFASAPGEDDEGNPIPGSSVDSFDPAQDDLVFEDQSGITGSYNDATGVLTLTGTAPVAAYETALQSVAYENVSEDPTADPRRIEFQLTDAGGAQSATPTRDVFVIPVNDAPVATASTGSTQYTGGDTPVDPGLLSSDVDDTHLEGAWVAIASGFETGDELAFVDQSGIAGVYDTEAGVLTLSGSATEADYQAALRSVAFDHAGGTPTGERSIEFSVNDGELDSAPSSKHLEVNDPPVLTGDGGTLAYTENDAPATIDSSVAATDVDSGTLAGATVSISAGFASGEDVLGFTDTAAISGSYSGATGVLTLSGAASVADYQAALRSVSYANTSEDPSTAARTVAFQVDDGAPFNSLSNTVTRDVSVTAVNDAPHVEASAGSTAYTEGDPSTVVDGGVTVSDVDDANLDGAVVRISSGFQSGDDLVFVDQNGISGVYNTGTGVLTLSGTAPKAHYETALRSIGYRHTGDDPGPAKTVEFTIDDGALTDSDTKEIAVTPVNDSPALNATAGTLGYTENDGAVAVDAGITAADPDSATLTGATVSISAGFASGEDALGFADTAAISGTYSGATGVLTLSGAASVADYEAALRSVTYSNSSDSPSSATRTVTFQADDGAAANNTSAGVSRDVSVSAVNDAPAVSTSAGSTAYTEGDPSTVVDGGVTVSDVDDANLEGAVVRISSGFQSGDDLVFVDQNGISGVYNTGTGELALSGTASKADYETALRSIGYRHTGDDPGPAKTVEFTAGDGDVSSAAATKEIAVGGVNDAPSVATSAGDTEFANGGADVAVDDGVTVSDPDDADVEGAVVRISSGLEAGDQLVFVDQSGISGVYNTATGTLTLSGSASKADYEAALRSIEYGNANTLAQAAKTVEFTVNDGDADSNTATKGIAVTGIA